MMPRLELHSAASTVLLRPPCSGPTTTPSTVCCRPEVRLTRHCTVHLNTSQHWTLDSTALYCTVLHYTVLHLHGGLVAAGVPTPGLQLLVHLRHVAPRPHGEGGVVPGGGVPARSTAEGPECPVPGVPLLRLPVLQPARPVLPDGGVAVHQVERGGGEHGGHAADPAQLRHYGRHCTVVRPLLCTV